ncbi:GDSL esterase/lipase-like protein [Drosera capensis]
MGWKTRAALSRRLNALWNVTTLEDVKGCDDANQELQEFSCVPEIKFIFCSRLLGLPYIKSYWDIFTNASLGINYASGDSGIRIEYGGLAGHVLNLDQQLKNHKCIVDRISPKHGKKYLNKCLYTVTTGSNDYANNYYGVEFVWLCNPIQVQVHGVTKGSTCFEDENKAVELFNVGLITFVNPLNANYPDANFTYINYRGIFLKPFSQDLKVCCPVIDGGLCRFFSTSCENRSEYIYWDDYHPTAAATAVNGKRAYLAEQPTDAYPIDISHLVNI